VGEEWLGGTMEGQAREGSGNVHGRACIGGGYRVL
jgi:hypothetical protein